MEIDNWLQDKNSLLWKQKLFVSLWFLITPFPCLAQIAPDRSLGPEQSRVEAAPGSGNLPNVRIEGGAARGSNLFHSFEAFNIGELQQVFFANPAGIGNIFTRVTGSDRSTILGTLGVDGPANFYLLNPNGILFGPNARIDIRGVFVFSTAESLQFADGGAFSAVNPEAPPLLTVAPSALQFSDRVSVLEVRGLLELQPGQSGILAGGEIDLNGGQIQAPGGRLALGGLAREGAIALGSEPTPSGGNPPRLVLADPESAGDVRLRNGAEIDVTGDGGGEVAIAANQFSLSAASQIQAGIQADNSSPDAQAGDVRISTREFSLNGESLIRNQVGSESPGSGGNIAIATDSLTIASQSGIETVTAGSGNAGDVTIVAGDLTLTAGGQIRAIASSFGDAGRIDIRTTTLAASGESLLDGEVSGIFSQIEEEATGNSEGILLETETLTLSAGARVSANSQGTGEPGSIDIVVGDTAFFTGSSASEPDAATGVLSELSDADRPDSQGITISVETGTLILEAGARIEADTEGQGNAGAVTVIARDRIEISGAAIDPNLDEEGDEFGILTEEVSGIFSEFDEASLIGESGGVRIETPSLTLRDGGRILNSIGGQGDAGPIEIRAAESVTIAGATPLTSEASGIFSLVSEGAEGADTQGISITTGRLEVLDGGRIDISTEGEGSAGLIDIAATSLILAGQGSGLFSQVLEGADGTAGDIQVRASESIALQGAGETGDPVEITAESFTEATGGNIMLTTPQLSVENNAIIAVENLIEGPAGNLTVTAETVTLDGGILSASTAASLGDAIGSDTVTGNANILLQGLNILRLGNESAIAANALNDADGGNISLDSQFIIAMPPTGPNGSDITANAEAGDGGRIEIDERNAGIFGIALQEASTTGNDFTVTSEEGFAGEFSLTSPEVDPSKNLAILPSNLTDISDRIDNRCSANGQTRASLSAAGLRALPPSPFDLLDNGTSRLEALESTLDSVRDRSIRDRLQAVQALKNRGHYSTALAILQGLQERLSPEADTLLKAVVLRHYGIALRLNQDLDRSQQVLEESLAIARRLNSPDDMGAALLGLANTRRLQQDPDFSESVNSLYDRALTLSKDPDLQLQAAANQFSYLQENELLLLAPELPAEIERLLAQASPNRITLYARLKYLDRSFAQWSDPKSSLSLSASPQPDFAIALFKQLTLALDRARALDDKRSIALVLGQIGKLYEREQKWSDALTVTQQALFIAQSINASDLTYQWQWQLGRIQASQGQRGEAIAAYTAAVNILQGLRGELAMASSTLPFSFDRGIEPIYRELVGLLLEPTVGRSPTQAELQQARNLMESLRVAELDAFFQDDCIQARPQQVERIDPEAAVIYPIILDRHLVVIISIADRPLTHHIIEVSAQDVQAAAERLRWAIDTNRPQQFSQSSQQLYDWLIRPALSTIHTKNIATLAFVLDGSLRTLPMAALHNGEEFLIEHFSVALAPGLELLSPKSPLPAASFRTLAGGISQARQGFSPLPQVETELASIQGMLPRSEVLLNQTFTEERFQASLERRPFNVIHLAAHGQFGSTADRTFVLTWDERLDVKELGTLLQTHQRQSQRPIELLVLSACETAKGDDRTALGIAGMAVRSGAQSTIASLWSLDDEAAALFMDAFYQQYTQPGTTKAEAFRYAQLKLLRNPKYAFPQYWAPLVLLGNWL